MKNNSPKTTHQQQKLKKLPQLQLLNWKQLDSIAGGPEDPFCPNCDPIQK